MTRSPLASCPVPFPMADHDLAFLGVSCRKYHSTGDPFRLDSGTGRYSSHVQ